MVTRVLARAGTMPPAVPVPRGLMTVVGVERGMRRRVLTVVLHRRRCGRIIDLVAHDGLLPLVYVVVRLIPRETGLSVHTPFAGRSTGRPCSTQSSLPPSKIRTSE